MRIIRSWRSLTLSLSAAAALAAASFAGAAVTIADVAPKNSMLVVSIDNAAATFDAFNRTGFKAVWEEPAVRKWIEDSLGDMFKEAAADLEKLGIDKDQLKRPTGPCGLAWWNDMDRRDENGMPTPHVMLLAEYASDAAAMDTVVKQLMEKAEKDKVVELTQGDHDGVTVFSCKFIEKEEEKKDKGGEGEEEDFDLDDESPSGPFGFEMKEMHYALAGTTLVAASTKDAVELAIDRVKGDAGASIKDSEDYNAIVRQLGDQQVRAVLLTREAMAESEKTGGDLAKKMNEATDFSAVRGVGAGLRFDADDAMLDYRLVVNAPSKKGFLALFDTSASPLEAPAFVPADAASVLMLQVDLPGVVPLVQKIAAEMPQDEGGFSPAQMITGFSNMASPILNNLGPQIYIVSSYERPFTAESTKTLYAIKAKDAQALSNAIGSLGAQFGLQAKDFQGNQIWSFGGGMMPIELSIGVGGGYTFIGQNTAVENALRATAAGEAGAGARLSTQDSFKKAMGTLGGTAQGFLYMSTRRTVEFADWMLRNMDKMIEQQLDAEIAQFGGADDPEAKEWKQQELKRRTAEIWPPLKTMPSLDVILKHVGDSVMEIKSTPEGFEAKGLTLKPVDEKK